ncbi:MAG: histidine--tRNA ligase [Armatimonadetes bacterium]|nr:histidine--tRNA ligase [Armatimonadota bacterium]
MTYSRPRGTHDILPEEVGRWRHVEDTFRRLCALYGYEEIRTPIIEPTELFRRSVGEHTDLVSKEMYTFSDPGQESLTLRAEGTAPTVRAYLQAGLHAVQPVAKLFYIGPIFRFERPQSGRYRQHHQVGAEAIGSADPAVDAEAITLGAHFLHELGITGEVLHLNSVGCPACRPSYREALRDFFRPHLTNLCQNCRRRFDTNPLRMLDCKEETCRAINESAPEVQAYLCPDCQAHFAGVRGYLGALGQPYALDHRLVRGLDYYTRTAFEFKHEALGSGAQNTVFGGGRYDGLVEECGGPPTPGIGFGMGIERVLLVCERTGIELPGGRACPEVYFILLGDEARMCGVRLLQKLRLAGIAAGCDYMGGGVKGQMRRANRGGARWAAILGENEVKAGVIGLKDLRGGEQKDVPLESFIEEVRRSH